MISKVSKVKFVLALLTLLNNIPVVCAQDATGSLFSVPFKWTAEDGKPFSLDNLKGRPTVVSMIYTQCKSACPLTIQRVQAIEKEIGVRAPGVNFLLVTLDPGRDKAEELLNFKKSHDIDRANWHLLTGSDADVRKFSVLIGVSFQKDSATQEILHSNRLVVLTPKGEIGFTLEGLSSDTKPLVDAVLKSVA